MNAGKTWGAILAGLVLLSPESERLMIGTVFSILFWLLAGVYFYLDYRSDHKKVETKPSTTFPPLSSQTIEEQKPTTGLRRKLVIVKNIVILILGLSEAIFCISLLRYWEIVTVPVENVSIPVLTYQNTALIGFFILGIFLVVNVGGSLRHSKKAIFEGV